MRCRSTCLLLALLAISVHAETLRSEPAAPASQAATRRQGVSISEYSVDLMQLYREARLGDPRVLAAYARAQAATALGQFVELGELEEIPANVQRKVEDALLGHPGVQQAVVFAVPHRTLRSVAADRASAS